MDAEGGETVKNLDTGLLKTFLEVAKTRHFGRAAENLYLTQSAVSSRIRQLEQLLNTQLFERHRHNILLTTAGQRLIPLAEGMLSMWQRTYEEIGLASAQQVALAIGAPANLWDAFLQQLIVRVACDNPQISLRTLTESSASLSRGLLERRVDIALMLDPPKVEECSTEPAGMLELQLVASEAGFDPQQPGALGYVALDWGIAFNLQLARTLPQQAPAVLATGQVNIAMEYLLSAGGWAWLPTFLVEPALAAGLLHSVEGIPAMQRPVFLVYRRASERREAIDQLVQQLRQDDTLPLPERQSDDG